MHMTAILSVFFALLVGLLVGFMTGISHATNNSCQVDHEWENTSSRLIQGGYILREETCQNCDKTRAKRERV